MNYNTILTLIKEQGYDVTVREVQKGGIKLQGVCFNTGEKIRPTIYPEGDTEQECAADAVKRFEAWKNAGGAPDFDLSIFTDWEKAKKHLLLCVRPITGNTEQVITVCEKLDLECYARVIMRENDSEHGGASIIVQHNHLESWNITEREFWAAVPRPEYIIGDMFSILAGGSGTAPEKINLEECPMAVMSNPARTHGAAAGFYRMDILQEIAKNNGDLYILPSSIHEVIITSVNAGSPEALAAMVKEVNGSIVAPEEILTDHVYKYSAGKIEIVA